jgi:hypothetical protein
MEIGARALSKGTDKDDQSERDDPSQLGEGETKPTKKKSSEIKAIIGFGPRTGLRISKL